MAEPMFIGVDVGGSSRGSRSRGTRQIERFRMAARAGVFDFVEMHASTGGDLKPYFELVDRYALPVRVIDGTWGIGCDEATARDMLDAGSRIGSKVLNLRLCGQRNEHGLLTDEQIVAFYLRLSEWGERVGCMPSLDACSMSSRDRARVASWGERIAQAGAPFRITLDLSEASDPLNIDWIDRGWVYHVRTSGVLAPASNTLHEHADVTPATAHTAYAEPVQPTPLWAMDRAERWKRELRRLIHWQIHERRPRLRQITCAFASQGAQGGVAALDVLRENVACARWLRDTWLCQMEKRYGAI